LDTRDGRDVYSKTVAVIAFLVAVAAVPAGAVGVAGADVTTTDVSQPDVPQAAVTGTAPSALPTQEDCALPAMRTDATGTEVTVEEPPQRIVAVGGSTSQIFWELGLQDRVVGMPVQSYTSYLNGSEEKTNVVTEDGAVDRERVVALEPDLVALANIYPNETAQNLRAAGLTVYKENFPSSPSGIQSSVETYGALTGACENATAVNDEFSAAIEDVESAAEGEESPRVFYYFFNFTAGSGTFTDELITTAGGTNVAGEAGVQGFRQVNLEVVAERDPQVLVVPDQSSVPTGEPWNSTTAYQEGNIVRVDTNLVQQPAPRVVQPLGVIQEAFAAAIQEDDQQTPAGDSGQGGPGFGVGAALVALAATALLATRRA
jgi:iron complex transport system substrate-binding protein